MTSTTLHNADQGAAAADFGDSRAEFQALLSGCGLYDLSWRSKIAVTGGDRVRWMNGMTTNNVRDLAPGHGVYAFLLNAQGRIQADLYVFHRGDSLLVDTERAQRDKTLELFDRYIIADDVELADISDKLTAIGLTGPQSRPVLERAGITVPELAHLQFADHRLARESDHAFTFRRRSPRILASLDCSRTRRRTPGRSAQWPAREPLARQRSICSASRMRFRNLASTSATAICLRKRARPEH